MIPSIEYLEQHYKSYNDLYFDGTLPDVKFKLVKAHSFLGKTQFKRAGGLFSRGYCDYQIKMSTSFDLEENELQDVLIHEMIHCYLTSKGIDIGHPHGDNFKRIMNDINSRYGRNIRTRYKSKDGMGSPRNQRKSHIICISTMNNGEEGITVMSPGCKDKILASLPKRYRLTKQELFVTSDPFFNRYPLSRKAVIYKIEREVIEKRLRNKHI